MKAPSSSPAFAWFSCRQPSAIAAPPARMSRDGCADERGGNEAEERQRGEAPADVGRVDEHLAVSARLGERLERGARDR